jgi:DNA-binding NtrC family response regulator
VIRDAARIDALRGSDPSAEETGIGRPAAELVGSAPLRDIVAQTTDAVERICIATAVELTGNNRVAAAEMLGLSRQSLYVKLRKYGLLAKDVDDE